MPEELIINLISILQSNLYIGVLVSDFLLKSALLVLLVIYFDRATSPYFSNNQKYWLWMCVLLMLSILPFTTSFTSPLLAQIPGEPQLTLFTVLVSADQAQQSLAKTANDFGIYQFALAAYAIVLTVHVLKLAASFFHVSRLKRRACFRTGRKVQTLFESMVLAKGIKREVLLGYSGDLDSPVTFGAIKPGILLPESMRSTDLDVIENVLIHELAHVKRSDSVLYVFAYFLAALSWFNPFVWVALKRLGLESEFACDSEVIAAKDCRMAFARQLVAHAKAGLKGLKPEIASRAIFSKGQLFLRVENILHANYRSSTGRTHSSLIPLFTIFLVFCWASSGKILALGNEEQFSTEALRLLHAEIPEYPETAIARGAAGFAQFSFTVDKHGSVDSRSIRLVKSEPRNLFEDSSMAALKSFEFSPRRIKGRNVATQDIHYTFEYKIKI